MKIPSTFDAQLLNLLKNYIQMTYPIKKFTIEKFITSIFILRSQFTFPQILSSLIIFLNNTQNLSYILQFELESYQTYTFYNIVWICLRPLDALAKLFQFERKYWFFVGIIPSMLENFGLILFFLSFQRKQNYEQFINKSINYFPLRIACYVLNFYIQIAGSVLYNQIIFLTFESLTFQLQSEENISFLLIVVNITFLLLYLAISLGFLLINENLITNQVLGVERVQITFLTFCYMFVVLFSPLPALFLKDNQRKYILCVVQILLQIILIADTYLNQIYVMLYQRIALVLSIAINTSFTLSILFISPNDSKSLLEYFVILFFPIFLILKCKCNFAEKKIIVNLFREREDIRYLRFGLMKLLNKDTHFDNQDIFYKILIGQWHQSNCENLNCAYCLHLTIQNPENMGCITTKMYKLFIEAQLQKFLFKKKNQKHNQPQQHLYLTYAIFLYDFGWIVKSIKILDFIYSEISSNKTHFNNQLKNEILFQSSPSMLNTSQNEQIIVIEDLNFSDLSWLEQSQIQFVIQEGKQKMKYNLFGSSLQANQQSLIQDFVNEHLHNEIQIKQFEKQIEKILDEKLRFFINLKYLKQSEEQRINRNQQMLQFFSLIFQTQRQFMKQQKTQLSNKVQHLQIFFWAEIVQDYKMAHSIQKNVSIPTKELVKLKKISNSNIPSQHFSYIILELCDNLQNFKILTHSQNFYQYYGIKNLQKKDFYDLLPNFIGKHHNSLVKLFFETGQNKFYYNFNLNYLMNPQNLISYVQMFHAQTSLFNNNNMTFAVYVQDAILHTALIVVDKKSLNCIFTKNLLLLVGWQNSDIELLSENNYFLQLSIEVICPEFNFLISNDLQSCVKVNSIILHLPTLTSSSEEIYLGTKNFSTENGGNKQLYFQKYKCDIILEQKSMDSYQYFILTIQKINSKQQTQQRLSIVPKPHKITSTANIQISEECQVGYENDSPNIGILNTINYSIQKQHSIKQNQIPIFVQLDSNPNVQNINPLNSNREETILQSDQIGFTQRNSQFLINVNSKINILQDSLNFQNTEFQDKKMETTIRNPSMNKESFSKIQGSDQTLKKREDLIRLLHQIKPKKFLLELQIFQFLMVFLVMIFIVIQYISLSSDFDSLMNCIEMTTIYAAIMAPHDLFFSMKATISSYQQMNREGFISSEQLLPLIEPYYQNIGLGFEEIKSNFFQQLNNQKLEHFFDDIYLDLNFMNQNNQSISSTNLSFRDSLFIILQYQFQYKTTISAKQSAAGSSFQVSIYSNYFQLHQTCQQLSQNIYLYSLNLHQSLEIKWITFWICFNVSFILIFIFLFIKMVKFVNKVQLFLTPINYIDEIVIHLEIQRQSDLIKEIHKDINVLNFYDPEVKLLERMNKSYSAHYVANKPYKKIQNNIIKYLNICVLVVFLSIIFIFTLLSIMITYQFFNQFEETAKLNLLIQEMKLRPGNLFLYREIFFRWQNFTYLTQDNKNYLYNLVDKGYESINDYLQIYNNIDFNKYLVEENFISFYESINSQNFCDQIDQKFQNLSSRYCSLAFEGSIQYGMVTTLKYIYNQMKAQQQINNFTKRVEFQYYEQEGSQIVSRLFFVLMNEFQTSLESRFSDIKILIQVLSISYFILLLIIMVLIIKVYYPHLNKVFKIVKYTINIIPIEVFLNNKFFERKVTELKYNLL